MVCKTKIFSLVLLSVGILFLAACGKENTKPSPEASSPAPGQLEDGIETPENVVLLGARSKDFQKIYKLVEAFNETESGYQVEIKSYDNTDDMFLDMARGKGCDLLLLSPTYLTILSDKGGLEDLTPYFEKSEKVDREDLFHAVVDAGSTEEKLAGIMPYFTVEAILVEKGYTQGGGWTVEEYLALMDKYPDVPLSSNIDPHTIQIWLMYELSALPEAFVNWDERTCDFESEAFIQVMETLKNYQERFRKTDIDYMMSLSDRLYRKQFQTILIDVRYGQYFSDYRDIRDAFLEHYELAGFPVQDGKACYPMPAVLGESSLYSINAASAKKDAAWLFLEYILSEYQETIAENGKDGFPVRRDIVERKLQEEIQAEVDETYMVQNRYTNEYRTKRGNFTEDDKEHLLYILDHASAPTILQQAGAFRTILTDELDAYFSGDKTAAEAAHLIQNRMTLYLNE